jgi:hypothetical protein
VRRFIRERLTRRITMNRHPASSLDEKSSGNEYKMVIMNPDELKAGDRVLMTVYSAEPGDSLCTNVRFVDQYNDGDIHEYVRLEVVEREEEVLPIEVGCNVRALNGMTYRVMAIADCKAWLRHYDFNVDKYVHTFSDISKLTRIN